MLRRKSSQGRSGRQHYLNQSYSSLRTARPFESLDALMESAVELVQACCAYKDLPCFDPKDYARSVRKLASLVAAFHKRLGRTDDTNPFVRLARSQALEPFEVEAVLVLIISRLRLTDINITYAGEIGELLIHRQRERLRLIRSLMPNGKLDSLGLIHIDKDNTFSDEGELEIDHRIVDWFLSGREEGSPIHIAASEKELHAWLREVSRIICRLVQELYGLDEGNGNGQQARRARRRFVSQITDVLESLSLHPEWKLAKLRELAGDDEKHTAIVIALLCKALGYFRWIDDFCTGRMLAALARWDIANPAEGYEAIGPLSPLIVNNIIRPTSGPKELISLRPEELDEIEFELTEQSLETLALEKNVRHGRREGDGIREPRLDLDQLVLSSKVRKALEMACVQVKHRDQLLKDWGIGANITYGRGVTLIFTGPPGVGKTAAAEGLAKELARPLLVVDYSEVQNCFVGETEKRIVSTFRDATRHNAVLFWDEADAMFFNRDDGTRTWEIRDVNVLLQELEKFEGVCILATNRKSALDVALERRITLKVNFERPTAVMRRQIWAKLVPATLPVADDVNYDLLSEHDLSGGEIKNVVLNAARSALLRSPAGPVMLADFQEAIRAEQEGRLHDEHRPRIGFLAAH